VSSATPGFGGAEAADEAAWLDDHFDACAPEYRRALEQAAIRPGDRVLDLGCGNGRFLPWIGEQAGIGGSVVAVDINVEGLRRLRSGSAALPPPMLLAAEATRLPLADGSFDVIWCANVFEYLDDEQQTRCLRELARLLRPGGRVAVKDSEWAHKVFYPATSDLWLRFLRALNADGGGPFVGRRIAGNFRAAGLTPRIETVLSERLAPLSSADRRWIGRSGRAVAADALRLLGTDAAAEINAFAALFDEASPHCILDRPDFYYCEGNVVVSARL
jgi:ubiquinone/menaquinone biosynthesis C-methylase UbiE